MTSLRRLAHLVAMLAAAPLVIGPLLNPSTGSEYGTGLWQKLSLIVRMIRNTRRIPVLSHVFEHFTLATAILKVPHSEEGCVVECGTYAGGSTANLSLVCGLVGRELEVFDSFAGLPELAAEDEVVVLAGSGGVYHAGQFSASLGTVRANVERWGDAAVCHFRPGFFEATMPGFARPCVLAFIDVDLRSSAETCLRYLWPRLSPGGQFYTHEAQELHMAALFFDEEWWQRTLERPAPGLAGAGNGLGLVPGPGGYVSELGYTIKREPSPHG
jgi:O-methyltransferase